MADAKIAVLGASGMLGAMVLDAFARTPGARLIATVRSREQFAFGKPLYDRVEWRALDAETASDAEIAAAIDGADWIVNGIGVIKPHIRDRNPETIERAIRVNALFPQRLAIVAAAREARVLQIATDCVYSGAKGAYTERDLHDPTDVYGMTKSLGEPALSSVMLLRCSIIGPEQKAFLSLLEWFLKQPKGARLKGFTNHQWNGVTTLHFAKLCRGIIETALSLAPLQHVIPAGSISKAEMLESFARNYGRDDVIIDRVPAETVIDRTLATLSSDANHALWGAAGYACPPTVPQMIEELARYTPAWQKAAR